MSGSRVADVPRVRSNSYLKRARSFANLMETALQQGNSEGAALAGVHSVIASCDALTVHFLGLRSKGQDHREVIRLLSRLDLPASFLTQVRGVVELKTVVEYDDRSPSAQEVRILCDRTRRILTNAENHLDRPG